MPMRPPLSVIVTTFNEVDQIADCLRSVSWADEVWLMDSFSTDGTIELVREEFPGVHVEQRTYRGAAAQKNYAIDRVAHDWILVIDADERVTPELRAEIERTLSRPAAHAFSIGRRNFVLGREVRYSGLQRDRVTRLFHRGHARYPNRLVHADLIVDGPVGMLQSRYDHFYVRSFDHMVAKMTRYGRWGAMQLFRAGKSARISDLVLRPLWRFVRDYLLNYGFLDGIRGLLVVGMHVFYTFWKYAKLWELRVLEARGERVELIELDTDEERWRLPWTHDAESSDVTSSSPRESAPTRAANVGSRH